MKKHLLWTIIVCVIPLSVLLLLESFNFGDIVNNAIVLGVFLIILMFMPASFEEETLKEANHESKSGKKRLLLISPKNLGFSIGMCFVMLYLTCMGLMYFLGHNGTVSFFNNMLHGLNTSGIIKMKVSFMEALSGLLQLFLLGTYMGILIGVFYNLLLQRK